MGDRERSERKGKQSNNTKWVIEREVRRGVNNMITQKWVIEREVRGGVNKAITLSG